MTDNAGGRCKGIRRITGKDFADGQQNLVLP